MLGILHFNKKTDVTNALLRISDSLAFHGATARGVYCVIDDAENDRKTVRQRQEQHRAQEPVGTRLRLWRALTWAAIPD